MGTSPGKTYLSLSASGRGAADLLAHACRLDLETHDTPQLAVIKHLAEDLASQLDALAHADTGDVETADLLAEAALRCADLANLAACNLSELSGGAAPKAVAAVHLAAGATRALSLLAESEAGGSKTPNPDYVRRDARGARWRADIAFRQVEEFVGSGSQE